MQATDYLVDEQGVQTLCKMLAAAVDESVTVLRQAASAEHPVSCMKALVGQAAAAVEPGSYMKAVNTRNQVCATHTSLRLQW